ncbi:MAG: glycosyltransferase [Candidatus Micrarchaeia archaeon]
MDDTITELKNYAKSARYAAYEALFSARKLANLAKITPVKMNADKPKKIRKVLLCMNRYEYGRQELGDSYEYSNNFPAIKEIKDADFFDFREIAKKEGRAKMHASLESAAMKGDYDIILFSLMNGEFDFGKIRNISEKSSAITMNWFADDQWRFASFSNYWAGAFNFVATTDKAAVAKYNELGYLNVIQTQWGVYAPRFAPKTDFGTGIDVAFVGQAHGNRKKMINDLAKRGIDVKCFGFGWKEGRISHQQMVDIFANAKINISPSDSSVLFAPKQMKARFFEVAACGGFQLAGSVEGLNSYFEEGKQIVQYNNIGEMAEKAKYYLECEDERKKIANAAKERCLTEHTYAKRFEKIFAAVEESVKMKKAPE